MTTWARCRQRAIVRYFIRRRAARETAAEAEQLTRDKQEARDFEWRARARSVGQQHSKVYARNFSFDIGQPASFEEKDRYPSAVEYLLGAVAGSLTTAFASDCARAGLEVDDIEISIGGRLHNILAHLGVEEGDPSFQSIEVKCFVSTFEDEERVRQTWTEHDPPRPACRHPAESHKPRYQTGNRLTPTPS